MQSDMRAMKQHIAAFMVSESEAAQDEGIANLAVRLDRIKRRLELGD